jgi:hypothetical protein
MKLPKQGDMAVAGGQDGVVRQDMSDFPEHLAERFVVPFA